MPPKVKITKQDIIDTALALIREGGESALNARAIAAALNCSTQSFPISPPWMICRQQ